MYFHYWYRPCHVHSHHCPVEYSHLVLTAKHRRSLFHVFPMSVQLLFLPQQHLQIFLHPVSVESELHLSHFLSMLPALVHSRQNPGVTVVPVTFSAATAGTATDNVSTIPKANNMPLLFFICAPPVFFRTYKRTLFILLYYTYINILIIFRYSFLTFPSLYVFFDCSLFSPTPFFLTFPENCTTIVTLLLCFIHRRILSLW